MSNGLSYYNSQGDMVMSASYLKKRGTCCKSGCLHCPYGFTVKKFGIQKVEVDSQNRQEAQAIFDFHFKKADVVSSLLGSAFKSQAVNEFHPEKYFLLTLKGIACGIQAKENQKVYLGKHFLEQGIDPQAI